MTRMTLAFGSLALVIAAGSPALAQDSMTPAAPKMSKADEATMKRCNAMSHAAAQKDAKCAAFMKAHPEAMMHADTAAGMKTDDAMKPH